MNALLLLNNLNALLTNKNEKFHKIKMKRKTNK